MKSRYVQLFIFFALGIFITYHTNILLTTVLFTAAFLIFVPIRIFAGRKTLFHILLILCFAAGSLIFSYSSYAPDEFNNEYVTVYGRVSELPFTYDGEYYYYIVKPKTLTYMDDVQKFTKAVRVCSENIYSYGDCIRVSGFLNEFDQQLNDTGFNTRLYYKSRGVFYKMTDIESSIAEKYSAYTILDLVLHIQSKCALYIDRNYTGLPNAYLKAFIIGDTRAFDDDTKDMLVRSGMRRFLYAPFIHVSIILSILSLVFWIFRTGRYRRDTISAIILLLYCAVNSTRPIFLKSLFAIAFILLYKKKFGYIHRLDAYAVSGFFTIVLNPMFLFDAGFIMSMMFSTLYTLFGDKLARMLSFLKQLRYPAVFWLIGVVGLMPVYAFFFNGTPILLPLIMPIAFLLTIIIIAMFWIGMTVHVLFSVGFVNNALLSPFLTAFDFIAQTVSRFPFSYASIATPTPYQILLFYSVLLLVRQHMLKRKNTDFILFLTTICICFACIISYGYISDIGKLKIMFVNVGQGDGAVVSTGYGESILIDGGGSAVYSDFNLGRYIYVPFLQSKGISKADAIVTHYHKDHCQGIIEAVRQLKIRTLFLPDCEPENEFRIQLLQAAQECGTDIKFVSLGNKISFPSGLSIEFISPDSSDLQSTDPNETSLVAYISYGSFSALFTGDTTKEQEYKMLEKGLVRKCDLLKVAHHGSDTSSGTEFINAANPSVAVISVGEDNTYALPDPEVIERLGKTQIMRTDTDGNITVTANKNGKIKIESYKKDE